MAKRIIWQGLLFFLVLAASAAEPVDFYATKSSSSDAEMITLTTDLYYNQLRNTKGYTVTDRRDTSIDNAAPSADSISFYAEIERTADEQWSCTLHAIDGRTGRQAAESKVYASYYKILLDAKYSITNLFARLSAAGTRAADAADTDFGIRDLYGTWDAEASVNKIVIMQNNRGFVIFNNGTSMNISVSMQGNKVTVKQTGRLGAQDAAAPIEWNLMAVRKGVLQGKKSSADGSMDVEWVKR